MSWTQKTLGEIVNLKRGFDLPSSSRVDGPIRFSHLRDKRARIRKPLLRVHAS